MALSINVESLSQRDRTGFTLFGSALIHIVVIMGIGFTYTIGSRDSQDFQSLATTISSAVESDEVNDADLFAESAQSGGGLNEHDEPASTPLPLINDPDTQAEQIARRDSTPSVVDSPFIYVELPASLLAGLEARDPDHNAEAENAPEQEGAQALIRSPVEADFDSELRTGTISDKQKFISSRTREHKYAAYMEAWRARIEQVGNSNYPDAARSRKLSGNLVLDVSILANGSVKDIEVVRSSGQKVLDDAAVRIVMMAAPYSPFPDDIRKEADILHITRTWQFLHNSTLIQN
ncbi:MAG: cell envelope biogenesis protein TonB [marine bacterium B5-7]|nr:MAG: cell envelope biogenesis protein TonB [marine bacterium B5-7]